MFSVKNPGPIEVLSAMKSRCAIAYISVLPTLNSAEFHGTVSFGWTVPLRQLVFDIGKSKWYGKKASKISDELRVYYHCFARM